VTLSVLDMVGWAHDEFNKILYRVDMIEESDGYDYFSVPDRDTFIQYANETDEPELMIALLDGKDIEPILWDRLESTGSVRKGTT